MKIIIHRISTNKDGTFGVLTIDGVPECVTLEETWLDNKKRVSCIPAGTYQCNEYSGTKYKDVWLVRDVPDRTAILIHWGNTEANTAGCILVGRFFTWFGRKRGIGASRDTFKRLKNVLPDSFMLEIKDHFREEIPQPKLSWWQRLTKGKYNA